MFRKQYKKANDSIKIENELIEKTINYAFSEKTHTKSSMYKQISSVAAVLVVAVGATVAYPKLVSKPVTENTTVYVQPAETSEPVSEAQAVEIIEEVITEVETVTTKPTEKVTVKTRRNTSKKSEQKVTEKKLEEKQDIPVISEVPVYESRSVIIPDYIQEAVPEQNTAILPSVQTDNSEVQVVETETVEHIPMMRSMPVADEISTAEASALPAAIDCVSAEEENIPMGKAYTDEDSSACAYNPEPETPEGFSLIATKFMEDGSVVYVYQSETGESFSVTETDDETNGKTYTFESETMTQDEMTAVYNNLP